MERVRSRGSSRQQPLDLLRGLLIVLMALDHANYLIAQQHSSGEYWGGPFPSFPSAVHFLTRFVTHLSAPGFFFLLGVGMVLFTSSRRGKGWSNKKIQWHFLLRGIILVSAQFLLNATHAWSVGGNPSLLLYLGVLAALGSAMILSIPLVDFNPWILVGIGFGLFVGMELLTPDPILWGKNFDQWAGTILVYSGGRGEFWSNYPLLTWLESAVLGLIFGKILEKHGSKIYRLGLWIGVGLLVGFVAVRVLNGFGTIRPLPISDWMDFLSVVKYPPSLAFILLTMGLNLILLGIFSLISEKPVSDRSPLLVFGRVPFLFYLVHILLYWMLGRVLTPQGSGLGVMYMIWIVGLAILYWPCRWYGMFKSRQSADSWVRLF